MKFRGTMSRKGVEVWTMESDDGLKILMASNDEMGRRRQDGGGPCDCGTIFRDDVAILTLANEHWVRA